MLEIRDVHAYYGNIHALKGVSLSVVRGEIIGLIGGNGAGKSTLMKLISALMRPTSGNILLNGERIDDVDSAEIVAKGVSQAPEGRLVFPDMTVFENLMMGAYIIRDKDSIKEHLNRTYQLFPRLEERAQQVAGTLSGGEQQMLAIGRALMAQPKLLLLDEPSMGLAPLVVEEIAKAIQAINEAGTTVLLVEQKAPMAFRLSKHIYIMETGNIVLSGTSDELKANERVKRIYLGQD